MMEKILAVFSENCGFERKEKTQVEPIGPLLPYELPVKETNFTFIFMIELVQVLSCWLEH